MNTARIGALAGFVIVVFSAHVSAQIQDPASDQLARSLRHGDQVWVWTGHTIRAGRVIQMSDGMLRLASDGKEANIPVQTIISVERKRNGVMLGTLIGAGVGFFAFGLPLASLVHNEGGDLAGPLLFVTAIGAGAGAGIDALLSVKRTIYIQRTSSLSVQPAFAPGQVAFLLSKTF
jgi:hypothetical protein